MFASKVSKSLTLDFEATRDLNEDSRLNDVAQEFNRNKKMYRWSSSAAALLTFSQFIVGGLLASSFAQEALPQGMVGLLGVVVLLSSLIHQRFRPDMFAAQAKQRMFKTRKLIRLIEDDLFAIKNGTVSAQSIFDVRQKASAGLSELEDAELEGASAVASQIATSDQSAPPNA
ncbi:MAG: hypothetical protein ABJP82_07145 [Hyphomicrobiales bacterium]